jgi:hypothetical protein
MIRPTPGNTSVSQVVLLDHGLCRELRESTRVNFCRLWEALVMRDDEQVIAASHSLGVKEWCVRVSSSACALCHCVRARCRELFAVVLLFRPYRGADVGFSRRASRADRMRTGERRVAMTRPVTRSPACVR